MCIKSLIDDDGQGMEENRTILQECGYSPTEFWADSVDTQCFTQFAVDRACIQIFWVLGNGRLIYVNDAACSSLGYTREELLRMSVQDITPHYSPDRFHELWRRVRDTGCDKFETTHRARDGHTYPVEIQSNFAASKGREYCCCFVTDISERKRTEHNLRDSAEKFRLLAEASPNAIVLIRGERIAYANPAATQISGFSREDAVGREFWGFLHEDFRAISQERILALQRGELLSGRYEYRIVTRNGDTRWVMTSSAIQEQGDPPAIIITFIDITEIKRTEESLRESETRIRQAMDVARLAQWEFDATTELFRFNDQFYTLYGTSAELQGGTQMSATAYAGTFIHPDDIPLVKAHVGRILVNEGTTNGQMEHRIIRADGEERNIVVRYWVNRDQDGHIVKTHGITQDITDQKRAEAERANLEAQLHQARKMEAIGQFAACIAHDFNNILAVMMGFAEWMLMRMNQGNPFRHHAKEILDAGRKAADLTRGLLAFSRKQVLHVRPSDPGEIINGIREMLRRLIPEDIDFRVTNVVTGMTVMADRGQIEQVIMNLVTNARDAMPTGGALTLEAGLGTIDEDFVTTHGFGVPGRYAMISIADSGFGMDKETREKLFEPFFTTKNSHKGTGLGLSIVYGIVKQHAGFITVDSLPGEGTTFHIYLPLIESEKEEEKHGIGLLDMAVGEGVETILLAEDDGAVRGLNRAILEEAGYRVIEATDGREALDIFREQRPQADILVTDLIMPNLDGKKLYEEIRKIRPDVKVLFMSGYARDILDARGILDDEYTFITKPVMPSELLKRVRGILERHH